MNILMTLNTYCPTAFQKGTNLHMCAYVHQLSQKYASPDFLNFLLPQK